MKSALLIFIALFSLNSFGENKLTPGRTYEDRIWGPTEVYELPSSNISPDTRYWLNQASVAEYVYPQIDMLDDARWSHNRHLKTESCWFEEFADRLNQNTRKTALQVDSKFFLENEPYVKRHINYDQPDRLHFTLKATYWGNPSSIVGRRLHVTCEVDLATLPLDDLASQIKKLIGESLRTEE